MTREKIEQYFGPEWLDFMAPFMTSKDYWDPINSHLVELTKQKIKFAPGIGQIFRCFKEVPLSKVRVVILGQDPYTAEGYANGLAFAHPKSKKVAPSLAKIIDGIAQDAYGKAIPLPQAEHDVFDCELSTWPAQGILLLNTALTVLEGKATEVAGSHEDLWRPFTTYVVKELALVRRDLIWLPWGQKAQAFTKDISFVTHFTRNAEHPSNAAREKRDWKHGNSFSFTNAVITGNGLGDKIKW
jgi:uracil-DNA glycosylase